MQKTIAGHGAKRKRMDKVPNPRHPIRQSAGWGMAKFFHLFYFLSPIYKPARFAAT
jgi:hypothetical protein